MGNTRSQPRNKTGRGVLKQKIENARKTGVLSLQEHRADAIPKEVFLLTNLTTLDVSRNKLQTLDDLGALTKLKSFNCDDNRLNRGALIPVTLLTALQSLSAGGNFLGKNRIVDGSIAVNQPEPLPPLPASIKQLKLDRNFFLSVPSNVCSSTLIKLERLDLSGNALAALPPEISHLSSLVELIVDDNSIVSLPLEIGTLTKLKVVSLKNNSITASSSYSNTTPQPIPSGLFTDTPVIVLNLHGSNMTFKQLAEFDGFSVFLERRTNVKSKDLYGGALTELDVCGLE